MMVRAAREHGLDPAAAAELCFERALVRADLTAIGRCDLYQPLLAVARVTSVTRPLPPAKAQYLRMLLAARDRRDGADAAADGGKIGVDVPLRLFPRVLDVAHEIASFGDRELEEALTLEIAAVSDGRTMSEWAVLAALRLSLY